jgi:hypothetical protein
MPAIVSGSRVKDAAKSGIATRVTPSPRFDIEVAIQTRQ